MTFRIQSLCYCGREGFQKCEDSQFALSVVLNRLSSLEVYQCFIDLTVRKIFLGNALNPSN